MRIPLVGQSKQQKKTAKKDTQQYGGFREFFQGMIEDLQRGDTQTYIVELSQPIDHRLVVGLFETYLRDHSGVELPYGEFAILGKAVRKIGVGESIDLLERSALSGLSEDMLSQFLEGFRRLGEQGLNIPEMATRVEAPALQIIPVAVYL